MNAFYLAANAAQASGEANEFTGFIVFMMLLSLYLLPWVISKVRSHHNSGAIFILNLFLGWTFLGWIGSLIWSFTSVNKGA